MLPTRPGNGTISPKQLIASVGDSRRGGSGDALGLLVGVALELDRHGEITSGRRRQRGTGLREELYVSGGCELVNRWRGGSSKSQNASVPFLPLVCLVTTRHKKETAQVVCCEAWVRFPIVYKVWSPPKTPVLCVYL